MVSRMEFFNVQPPGQSTRRFVKLFVFPGLLFVLSTSSALPLQPRAVSLCVVDTKLPYVSLYDPPAGPFATGMYRQLAGRQLKDGSKLHIIVFPASPESTIVPEIHRVNCSWVLQLRFQLADEVFGQTYPRRTEFDSLLYTVWNGATGEIVKRGSGLVPLPKPVLTPYTSIGKQVLEALNHRVDGGHK